jgi:hypothetical protein
MLAALRGSALPDYLGATGGVTADGATVGAVIPPVVWAALPPGGGGGGGCGEVDDGGAAGSRSLGAACTGILRPTAGTAASTNATVIFATPLRTPEAPRKFIDHSSRIHRREK